MGSASERQTTDAKWMLTGLIQKLTAESWYPKDFKYPWLFLVGA
jgi:hypothetical protein